MARSQQMSGRQSAGPSSALASGSTAKNQPPVAREAAERRAWASWSGSPLIGSAVARVPAQEFLREIGPII